MYVNIKRALILNWDNKCKFSLELKGWNVCIVGSITYGKEIKEWMLHLNMICIRNVNYVPTAKSMDNICYKVVKTI